MRENPPHTLKIATGFFALLFQHLYSVVNECRGSKGTLSLIGLCWVNHHSLTQQSRCVYSENVQGGSVTARASWRIAMQYGTYVPLQELVIAHVESLLHLPPSFHTQRWLEDNALTTLPEGIFEDLTALTNLLSTWAFWVGRDDFSHGPTLCKGTMHQSCVSLRSVRDT